MNEPDSFEAELQRLRPAKPSEEFMASLAGRLMPVTPKPTRLRTVSRPAWLSLLRWLAPAAGVAAVLAMASWRLSVPGTTGAAGSRPKAAEAALKADNIEIDRQLIADFDAVARLPGGESMRFRCRKWADDVVLHDTKRGITIEHRMPRLEVVPVSWEQATD